MRGEAVVPRVKKPVAWVELDGEVVVYDGVNSSMHLLNPAAAAVWIRCDGEASVDEITRDLVEAYEADEDRITKDVEELVAQLGSKGLLEGVPVEGVPVEGVPVEGVPVEGVAVEGVQSDGE